MKSAISHLQQLCQSIIRRSRPGCMDRQWLDHVHAHHQGRRRLLPFNTTTTQRTAVSVAGVFHTTHDCCCAIAAGLLQWSPRWTSCQSTQLTAVRSPRGGATHPLRPSTQPLDTTAAAASLAACARARELQTLLSSISLSAWSRYWVFLGGFQAHVRDSTSPETAFSLQYRCHGSSHVRQASLLNAPAY